MSAEQPGSVSSAWGRVADDGTVYLRTEDGERAVGSWQAGPPEAGLAYYERRYAELEAEVGLLEQRAAGAPDVRAVRASARKLREALPTASAVGDLGALDRRLGAVLESVERRAAEQQAERAAAGDRAEQAKRTLVEEAEALAASTDWKRAGDRLRDIVGEWREIRGVDRKVDQELWRRFAAARDEFGRRRGAHFATLDEQRKSAQATKEQLVAQAESLADSTEWGPTSGRYRELMSQWKAAGRAGRAADDALWARFRAAQDAFFSRRAEHFAERDAESRAGLEVREALVVEAEAIDTADPVAAQRRLRHIHERWDKAPRVPREALTPLDRRMSAVEDRVRAAADARWRRPVAESSPLVIRLRESVTKLEGRVARLRREGKEAEAREAEASLTTQREWLAQAESAGS